jgi:hypothetical protein
MIMSPEIFAFHGLVWLGIIGLVVYGPWQRVCVDYARDVMFEQRDRVFDMAINGDLQLGSEPYETIRANFNAMIRMAHCVTVPRLVFLKLYGITSSASSVHNGLWSSINNISDERIKNAVAEALNKAEMAAIIVMVARSPVLLVALLFAKIFGKISDARKVLVGYVAETLEKAIAYEAR